MPVIEKSLTTYEALVDSYLNHLKIEYGRQDMHQVQSKLGSIQNPAPEMLAH